MYDAFCYYFIIKEVVQFEKGITGYWMIQYQYFVKNIFHLYI